MFLHWTGALLTYKRTDDDLLDNPPDWEQHNQEHEASPRDQYYQDAAPENYQDAVPDIVFLRHRSSGWHGRSMRYNKTIRSETREAWNKNGMDAGGVLFFLVARAVCACIYVMVLLLLLC